VAGSSGTSEAHTSDWLGSRVHRGGVTSSTKVAAPLTSSVNVVDPVARWQKSVAKGQDSGPGPFPQFRAWMRQRWRR
jgi:hypothetical protein